ncbi:MAG TPA: TonB-dependent receptor [Steroidobacteraceae bacterium]|jgi:iron complex outermembrane receptor protein
MSLVATRVDMVRSVACAALMTLSPVPCVLAADATPGPASAVAADAAAADSGSAQLEEITVTAERVSANLQKVPIAVNAVTAEQLEKGGVINIQSLSALVPNVVNTGNTSNFTYIRGIGSSNASLNNEAAVATYVDGVYMASPYGQFGTFNNISRIEVLKGPQGTLFGRDTTGGVIQIITPDPSHNLASKWQVSYGNYNAVGAKGYLTGGLGENMAADLALVYDNQIDGYGRDLCPDLVAGVCTPEKKSGRRSNFGARSKWLWQLSDTTKIVGTADYDLFLSDAGLQMAPGAIDSFDHATTYYGRYNFVGVPYSLKARQYGGSLNFSHDFSDGLEFVSISSWRQLFGHEIHDNTRTPNNALYTIAEESRGTYQTQEFQVIDTKPGRLTWLAGVYYFGDVVGYDPRRQTGSLVNTAKFLDINSYQTIRSYSAYGQATVQLFDKTKLELGARYTDESVQLNGQYQNAAGAVVSPTGTAAGATVYDQKIKYYPWTYRASLDRDFTPDVMGYVSYTHGFKSGGYNLPTPQRNPFLPEEIDSYEVGVKSELMDHRMRLNVSAYYYNYQDIQVVIVPGLSGQLFTNAGGARANGLDIDFQYAATSHLTFRSALGYLHGYYTNYPNAQSFTSTGVAVAIPSAEGFALPYAPKYSGNVGLTYTIPTSIGDFVLAPTVAYTDKYPFTTDTNFMINRIIMVNAQVEWDSRANEGLSVQVYGNNLADQYYYVAPVQSSGGWYGTPGTPRTYGVRLLQKF